jgi:UDP-N-acetylmuramoyl-tripeptide--D-alanyl-D-alanine ligase
MNIEQLYKIFTEECSRVSTDSRNIQQGDLFIALKGENFNGNRFAADALKQGARYAVIDEAEYGKEGNFILVENTLKTLQQLARHHRDQFNIPFIAIAGSNGKTTTKELIKEVLKTSFVTYSTPGNFNNEIGTPLTLLQIKNDAEAAVIEMGARQRGDIAELCEIANPTHGIITNTGKDHLETFGTLENTLKTNAELFEYLATVKGTAFVSTMQNDLMQVSAPVAQRITYGEHSAQYNGKITKLFPFLEVSFEHEQTVYTIATQLTGKYNFENIMAAVAIGLHFNIHPSLIKKAIENYAPQNNRSQILRQGSNTFIMDAYNANPSSMSEALDNLNLIEAENKIAVLGDMLELGTASYEEHLLMALRLKNMQLNKVILVGEEFGKVADKLPCLHFNNIDEVKNWFATQQFTNTIILLKGSRKMTLEKLVQ